MDFEVDGVDDSVASSVLQDLLLVQRKQSRAFNSGTSVGHSCVNIARTDVTTGPISQSGVFDIRVQSSGVAFRNPGVTCNEVRMRRMRDTVD